ncbi:MAG: hypothetical protein IPK60_13575 [Sandaracinaceae bacterium]|jgi:hypothetical protein|nr:hypothetical protein [Sandaracinaceae bacterium]
MADQKTDQNQEKRTAGEQQQKPVERDGKQGGMGKDQRQGERRPDQAGQKAPGSDYSKR